MELELHLAVSAAVILGTALVALIVDYLKGSNEQLREHNIELRVRREEERKRAARTAVQPAAPRLEAAPAPATPAAVAAVRPEPVPIRAVDVPAAEGSVREVLERAARRAARAGGEEPPGAGPVPALPEAQANGEAGLLEQIIASSGGGRPPVNGPEPEVEKIFLTAEPREIPASGKDRIVAVTPLKMEDDTRPWVSGRPEAAGNVAPFPALSPWPPPEAQPPAPEEPSTAAEQARVEQPAPVEAAEPPMAAAPPEAAAPPAATEPAEAFPEVPAAGLAGVDLEPAIAVRPVVDAALLEPEFAPADALRAGLPVTEVAAGLEPDTLLTVSAELPRAEVPAVEARLAADLDEPLQAALLEARAGEPPAPAPELPQVEVPLVEIPVGADLDQPLQAALIETQSVELPAGPEAMESADAADAQPASFVPAPLPQPCTAEFALPPAPEPMEWPASGIERLRHTSSGLAILSGPPPAALEPEAAPSPVELPAGYHSGSAVLETINGRDLFSGFVVSISIHDFERIKKSASSNALAELLASIEKLMRGLLRECDFGCRVLEDEYLIAHPGLTGAAAQRRASHISERLWDFQLRSLGSFSVIFNWGGVEVHDEPFEDAVAAAFERMNEIREGRRSGRGGMPALAKRLAS